MEHMKETYFKFNGRNSQEFGLKICHDEGIFERQFGPNRKLNTETIPGSPLPYAFGFEHELLSGEIQMLSEHPWTLYREREICNWLFQDNFGEFISLDNPDIVYYVIFIEDGQMSLGTNRTGYFTVNFTCDAPWGWSKPLVQQYELKDSSPFRFTVDNIGNVPGYNALEIELKLPDASELCTGDYRIRNTRNTAPDDKETIRAFQLKSTDNRSLLEGETICVHMGRDRVLSDNPDRQSRFANCNRKFVRLEQGPNILEVSGGPVKLTVRCQYPILR